jgi:glucose-6-phosphate isomerase
MKEGKQTDWGLNDRQGGIMRLHFEYKNSCGIDSETLQKQSNHLLPIIQTLRKTRTTGYTTDYGSINLSFDDKLISAICSTVSEKKLLNPSLLIVVGIGGSNLGTLAILQALRGKFYNHDQAISVYFADTIDTDTIAHIAHLMEQELMAANNVLLNIISKSGTTTETLANFEIFLEILKNHRPYNYHRFVVVTTDHDSALWHRAEREKFTSLTIPQSVGGRYSVFSAVGLFPLCMLGIDIQELCNGAQEGFIRATDDNNKQENYAALSASIIAHHYTQNRLIHDTFLFTAALENIGAWYRQLSAESIGKALNKKNKSVHIGLLPTISLGSTDLHSVAQLYFAGPDNRFTTFINVTNNTHHLILPEDKELEMIAPYLQNKSLTDIMNAILEGTKQAYAEDNRPFVSYTLPERSAYYVAQFMQMKMIEIMYLGYLLDINPFDQPEVEKYKAATKKILTQSF